MTEDIIRLLTLDDLAQFHALRLRACREEPTAFMEAYEELAYKPVEEFTKYFDNGWIAGAFMDGQLAATAGLFRHKGLKVQHKGTVWGVYTAPQARGKRFSRRCIESVLKEAKQAGLERVHLSTNTENPITIALYQSLGFEPWGVEKHILKLTDGSYVDDVMMTKSLV